MDNIRIEQGIVVGTAGDKYVNRNLVARYLVNQFDASIAELASMIKPKLILEIGCGEGHVTRILLNYTQAKIHATEISSFVLDKTKKSLLSDRLSWEVAKLETYQPSITFEMVVCCEVIEHLIDPNLGLEALYGLGARYYLLSVPREPLWRILNMLRGAYLKEFGNSPGHIQHWSRRAFISLVSNYFEIVQVRNPLPWTVLLCHSRG